MGDLGKIIHQQVIITEKVKFSFSLYCIWKKIKVFNKEMKLWIVVHNKKLFRPFFFVYDDIKIHIFKILYFTGKSVYIASRGFLYIKN